MDLQDFARQVQGFDLFKKAFSAQRRVSDVQRRELVLALLDSPMPEAEKSRSLALAMGRLSGMQDHGRIEQWWEDVSTNALSMKVALAQGLRLDPGQMDPFLCMDVFDKAVQKSGVEMAKMIWKQGFAGGAAPASFARYLVENMFAIADYEDLERDDEMMAMLGQTLSSIAPGSRRELAQTLLGMKTLPSNRCARWLDVFFPCGMSEQEAENFVAGFKGTGISVSQMEEVELATKASIARWEASRLDAEVATAGAKRVSRL